MKKSDELADPNSCLNKAADDEPIFVLRAKDPIAASVVRYWELLAQGIHEKEKREKSLNLTVEMEQWRSNNHD